MKPLMIAVRPTASAAAIMPARRRRRSSARACRIVLTVILGLTGSSIAAAQDDPPPPVPLTRAAELEAARRAKATALEHPPTPNTVERTFTYIEDTRIVGRIFNPTRGWFAQVGGAGEGNGFTVGGGYRQPTPLGVVSARAVGSMRQSYLASVDVTRAILPGDAAFVTTSVTRRHEAAQRFYGMGPDASAADKSSFGLSATQADVTTGVHVTSWLTAVAGVGVLQPYITRASEARRVTPTTDAFSHDPMVAGLTSQPTFATAQAGVIVDTRDAGNARHGGLYQVHVRRFADRDEGAYSFSATRVDLQQFIPFWNRSRVLALRVLADHTDGIGSAAVPFYLMPTLGGARSLRGYERQRFRDRSALLISAEYRYEVNPFLMGAIFYDAGQVAPDWSTFRLSAFRDNYGIGLRFGYSNAVALRADLAFGGERPVRLILGFNSSF